MLAVNCALAGAETQLGRPLNTVVRRQETAVSNLDAAWEGNVEAGEFRSRSREISREALYTAINQHWVHAEQTRWWLLYDFLMANSVLILAWAAVFAGDVDSKRIVMGILSGAGILLCAFWLVLSERANSFVDMYGALGRSVELSRPAITGPFGRALLHRDQLDTWWNWVRTSRVMVLLPVLFLVVYVVLGAVAYFKGSGLDA